MLSAQFNNISISEASNFDKLLSILIEKFKIPCEVIQQIYFHVPIKSLIYLGANYKQIKQYKRNVTFESFKNELSGDKGYEITKFGAIKNLEVL